MQIFYDHDVHPATPEWPGSPDHDPTVPKAECLRCHLDDHAQYEQDVLEVAEGRVTSNEPIPEIPPNSLTHGPCVRLQLWHAHNGYCPLLSDGPVSMGLDDLKSMRSQVEPG